MTQPTPKSTSCCGLGLYWSPLFFVGTAVKMRFAVVRCCSKCHKLVGDPKLDYANGNKALETVLKLWNGTSWSMALDAYRTRPGAPLDFEKGGIGILVPVGYQGEVRAQAEFSQESEEEPPF